MSDIQLFIAGVECDVSIINMTITAALGEESFISLYVLASKALSLGVLKLMVSCYDQRRTFVGEVVDVHVNRCEPHTYEITAKTPFIFYCDSQLRRRCFVKQSIQQIIQSILAIYPNVKVSWALCCRSPCIVSYEVQYDETDFAFVRRLMSMYGYSYYWDGDMMMVIDDVAGYALSTTNIMPFRYLKSCHLTTESCRLITSSSLSAFIRPSVFNTYHANYWPGYHTPAAKQQRLEHLSNRIGSRTVKYDFSSCSLETMAGRCLPDKASVVVAVVHHFYIDGQMLQYENQGVAVPVDCFYSMPEMRAPVYVDTHEATVVDIEHGTQCRVRLTFPWDSNRAITPWVAVMQSGAGDGYGFQCMPCLQDAVLVRYQSGLLTCPIVMGLFSSVSNHLQVGHPEAWIEASLDWLSFSSIGDFNCYAKQTVTLSVQSRLRVTLDGEKISTWQCRSFCCEGRQMIEYRVGDSRLCLDESGIVMCATQILLNSDDQTT